MNVGNGADWVDVPENMRRMPCLDDQEVTEIAKLAVSLEEKLGCPQDVEWAIDQDLPFPRNLFHLQTRPAKVQAKENTVAQHAKESILRECFHSSFSQIRVTTLSIKNSVVST